MSASFIRQQQHSPPLRFATSSGTGGSPSVYPFSTAQTSATTGSYTTSLPPTSTSLGGQPLSYPYAASGQQGLVSSNVMGDYSRYGDSLAPHPGIRNSYFDQVAAASMGIANVLTEQLLSHPCIVLRRQCQVHADARSYHQTPFTLLPIAFSLRSNQVSFSLSFCYQMFCFMDALQGISSLWKGVGSSIVVKGMTSIVEILIGDTLGLPRYIVDYAGWDKILQHVALKMLSFCITTPFTVAAFIESVRSDTASDRTNPWDCVTNGLARLRYDLFGPKDNSKRFSIFYLAVPSVTYRFSHYVLAEIAYNLMYRMARRHVQRKAPRNRTLFDDYFPALFARFASSMIADVLLYPLETVLHRLYIQGTRTIIDNLDTGVSVVAVTAKYQGVTHCFSSIFQSEGVFGFYKGMGALALQYTMHFMVLRLTRAIFDNLEEFLAERHPTPPPTQAPLSPMQFPILHDGRLDPVSVANYDIVE